MFKTNPPSLNTSLSKNNLSKSQQQPQMQYQSKNQMMNQTNQAHYTPYQVKQRNMTLTASNQTTQYFCFKLKDGVQGDSTSAWKYNIPVLKPNQKYLYLSTQAFTTTLKGYVGQQYPQSISIGLEGYSGFINDTGTSTNKIIIMNVYQTQTYVVNGIIYKDIIYKNDNVVMWNLGSLRQLNFFLFTDEQTTAVSFPISNPITLSFRIIHVSI